jgi:hypothetical protein
MVAINRFCIFFFFGGGEGVDKCILPVEFHSRKLKIWVTRLGHWLIVNLLSSDFIKLKKLPIFWATFSTVKVTH